MNIIIISLGNNSRDTGSNVRNYYLHQALEKKYHAPFIRPESKDMNSPNSTLPFFKRVFYILIGKIPYIEEIRKNELSKENLERLKKADVVQLQEMRAYYFIEKYLHLIKGKIILDTHNVDHIRFLAETDNKGLIEKIMGRVIAPKIQYMEIQALKKIDYIFVCSEPEKEYYKKYKSADRVIVVPNGVQIYKKSIQSVKEHTMLFMGLLSYPPNENGLKHYLDTIHPIIKSKYPKVKLSILGPGCPDWLKEYAKKEKTVKVEGFVKDVKEYIRKAKVCISPVYSGSGTRLKTLEYMSMGKPVVSSSKGAEGINVANKSIFVTDDDNEFANNVMKLFDDNTLCKTMGANAKKSIEKNYEWQKIQANLLKIYNSL